MKKYLFIAEKPSLMREVEKAYKKHKSEIEGKVGTIDFIALSGHVCRLLLPNEYDIWDIKWDDINLPMIPSPFKIDVITDKKNIVRDIKNKLKETEYDGIIVGTDSDVEGNGIYYLLENYLSLTKMEALRFYENDLTEKALLDSLRSLTDYHTNPRDVHMTEAFKIRSHMDWLIGMNFSVGFSVKAGFTMRVGRVKVPTLKLVYDNSKEIDEFVPHTDYELQASYVEGFNGTYINAEGNIRFKTEEDALNFSKTLSKNGTVKFIEKKIVKTNAPQLYKLSDIQVEAGKQYGYDPTKTLNLVQSLYETHKLVSYPRTDGRYISEEKAKEFPSLLKAVAAIPELTVIADGIKKIDIDKVKKDKRVVNDAEVKKASHDALLPTGKLPDVSKLSKDEQNILTLIYKRLLALFLPQLEEEKTVLLVDIDGNEFKTNGKVVLSRGWTSIYDKKSTDTELPKLKEKDILTVKNFMAAEKTTTPPARLTQATLIAAMENIAKYIEDKKLKNVMKDVKGIGMPSSRAKIISDLISSGYMEERRGKVKGLYITDTGKKYIENIDDFSICKPELTAEWETRMQQIKEGSESFEAVEKDMIQYVKEMTREIESTKIKKSGWAGSQATEFNCPICGHQLNKGKYGWYCSNKKEGDCSFTIAAEFASKKITDSVVRELMTKGVTKEISGFKSKTGKKFSAKLKLNEGKVEFDFEKAEPKETKASYKCPCCGKNIMADKWAWKCENNCGFSFSYKIAGKEMKESDLKELIRDKKTKKIAGFVSKAGKRFSASIVLNKDGSTGFDFK
ncbi:type IA DNA topoisomerase [Lacrimispora amygdalina]|uniref:type IA DNA topoisomerase n=1 Tax=Lacrimispora amygdalina TaxID=253257 RepID=UPI000BE48142|nr:type IA DNA topoisomerase [Lacrimispora amygdalina]